MISDQQRAEEVEAKIHKERVSFIRGDSSYPFECASIVFEALAAVRADQLLKTEERITTLKNMILQYKDTQSQLAMENGIKRARIERLERALREILALAGTV